MAEEADIKRIVIQVEGDEISQRETSQSESEALHDRLDQVIQEVAAGEHPEPIIPAYHPEETPQPVVDQNAAEEDHELDISEDLSALTDSVDDLVDVMSGGDGSGGGTNGHGGGGGGSPPVPPGGGGGGGGGGGPPSPPGGGGGGGPPTPPPPPVPPGRPPTPAPPVPPGPPPVPAGGGAAGGIAGAAAEFLGPIGLVIVGVEAVVTTVEELIGIAQDIDQHIMSLADDIRPYSGDIQAADAYSMIREMTAMIERANAIGGDVASYEVSRADFNASITSLVTKLEQEFLPIAVVAMKGLSDIADFVDTNSELIVNLLTVVSPHVVGLFRVMSKIARGQADAINKNNLDKASEFFTQIEDLMRGNFDFGSKQNRRDMKANFPAADGVFF